jgi:hypothetical protein
LPIGCARPLLVWLNRKKLNRKQAPPVASTV